MLEEELLGVVFLEAAEVDFSAPHVAARWPENPTSPILISVIKDEIQLLPDFFTHYRRLGVDRFVIIDNGSVDGSKEYCAEQPDADVHCVDRPFLWPQKQGWITRAITDYGLDRWYIYVDADERLVFDGWRSRSLTEFAQWADDRGLSRIRGVLIDMYSDSPVLETRWPQGYSLAQAYPYFDTDGYNESRLPHIISCHGGPRRRIFGNVDPNFNPEMTKYPMFRPTNGDIMINPHHFYPHQNNLLSDCYIGLLHYKFLPGFMGKIRTAVNEKTYWNDSYDYRTYLTGLRENPNLTFKYLGSRKYKTEKCLMEAGLIASIEWRDSFIIRLLRSVFGH